MYACFQTDGYSIVSGHSQYIAHSSGNESDEGHHDDSSSSGNGNDDSSLEFSDATKKKVKNVKVTKEKQRAKILRQMAKNRRKDLKKRESTDADGFTVWLLRELYRNAGSNRNYLHVRLCDAFDRHFTTSTCTKTDMLNRDCPLLGSLIIDGYFDMHRDEFKHFDRMRNRCLAWVYDHLAKYETIAVNDAIINVCEELRHADSDEFPELLFAVAIPSDQLLHSDSMLTSRAANVCVAFSMYGRCDSEKLGREKCSGRHICIEPLCRTRRSHCTPMCTSVNNINPMNLEEGCVQRIRGSVRFAQQSLINRNNRYQQQPNANQYNGNNGNNHGYNRGNNGRNNNGNRNRNKGRGRGGQRNKDKN